MNAEPPLEFVAYFKDKFGADWPVALWGEITWQRDTLWLSGELAGALEHPPMVPGFLDEPAEYLMAGCWGHSVNSYAFYFIDKREHHRRFFRLPYGGIYGDRQQEGDAIVAFLAAYERWRAGSEEALATSTLTHNMGRSCAQLITRGGREVSMRSAQEGTGFWDELSRDLARP